MSKILCSENIGADQLHGYHADDLRLCYRICKKTSFFLTWLIFSTSSVALVWLDLHLFYYLRLNINMWFTNFFSVAEYDLDDYPSPYSEADLTKTGKKMDKKKDKNTGFGINPKFLDG